VDPTSFVVNGRTYVMPAAPVVVICIDGSEPDYHVAALDAGRMPWLRGVLDGESSSWPAHCALPALTNPNNLSIATGHRMHRGMPLPSVYSAVVGSGRGDRHPGGAAYQLGA
jgi:hypothetical protein